MRQQGQSRILIAATRVLALSLLALVAAPRPASAVPISNVRTESNIDFVTGAVSGVGGGSGSITISGVSGTVKLALLYWHGIDNGGAGEVYDNQNITFDGNAITGTAIGDATTNCWGDGSSRAFRADVTAFVAGNGVYALAGLSSGANHNANGASLVVIFDDGNPSNNRDLVFFEGNDSNIPQGFPGEDDGWHATLSGINYSGGTVNVQLHAADGQVFVGAGLDDGPLTFTSGAGNVVVNDAAGLWDGNSVPTAGTSRAPNGELWDVHTFDVTAAFGPPGPQTLSMDGMDNTVDCLGLVLLLMDLEPGTAPTPTPTLTPTPTEAEATETPGEVATPTVTPTPACGNGTIDAGETCDPPNSVVGPCGQTCRDDCTYCGDAHVNGPAAGQPNHEECDDGNCAECDPIHPQKPLDACRNNCMGLICKDPSRIKLLPGPDSLSFHGRLAPFDSRAIDVGGKDVSLGLSAGGTTIFQATLRPSGESTLAGSRVRYRNSDARRNGGIYKLIIRNVGKSYAVSIIAYGDLSAATEDMVAEVTIGGKKWTVDGHWHETPTGWVFRQ